MHNVKRTALGIMGFMALSTLAGAASAKVSIDWMASKNGQQIVAFKKIFTEFEKESNIHINPVATDWSNYQTKVLLSVASGRFTELYSWGLDYFTALAQGKALVPLDGYIKGSKLDISRQSINALDAFTIKGQLWGLPYGFYPVVMYYNRNLFDAAGVPYPSQDWDDRSWNWEAFVDAAKKLTKRDANGKVTQQGLGGMQWHYFYPWYFGGDWSDQKLTESRLMDPKTLKGLQEVADLSLKHKVTGSFDFTSGKTAMTADGCWATGNYKQARFKWDIAATPWGTNHSVPAFVDGFSMGFSKHRKEAWTFINWLYSKPDRVESWLLADSAGAAVPSDKRLQARYLETGKKLLPGINLKVCADAMDYATPLYLRYSRNWPRISQLIDSAVSQVMLGKKPAKDALGEVAGQVAKLIKTGGTR